MARTFEKDQEVERSIITKFRKDIWSKFTKAIQDYELIQDGDKIAVCMSGGKDSSLLAKLFQELKKHGKNNFEVEFIVMDPGYTKKNREKIIDNCKLLNIPINIFDTDIFERVEHIDDHPCYLCARMRRGYLYEKAKELGCNKIALGHHFNDVIETIMMGILYGAQVQTMMPKVKSTSHPGMELIRPLYLVKEDDIIRWANSNNLEFLKCACKVTEKKAQNCITSKREEMKQLIKTLKKTYDNIDMNIFNSVTDVNLDTIISYYKKDDKTSFHDNYES